MADETQVEDQEFFLALARPSANTDEAWIEARERWNAWRRDPANANKRVTFAGVDFSADGHGIISFEGFEFGDRTSFDAAIFDRGISFANAIFGDAAKFVNTNFCDLANFSGAKFGDWARFDSAIFGESATFTNTKFRGRATFVHTKFGFSADFDGSIFGANASFANATFGELAGFINASFGDRVSFNNTTFGSNALFLAALFRGSVSFAGEPCDTVLDRLCEMRFGEQTEKNREKRKSEEAGFRKLKKRDGFGPHRFLTISFSNARFCGPAIFSGRDFEKPADFTSTHFQAPPYFDGATNLQRIDFTGSKVRFVPWKQKWWMPHWTNDSTVAIRLRAFRAIAETTKNHDLERDLYIEERKAERGIYWSDVWEKFQVSPFIKAARVMLGRRRSQRPALLNYSDPARQRLRHAFLRRSRNVAGQFSRLSVHGFWIAVMGAYWLLADYGRSVLRPAAWLAASIWGFQKIYSTVLTPIRLKAVEEAKKSGTDAAIILGQQYDAATDLLALSNAVPFVGPLSIDTDIKKFLLCGKVPQPVGTVEKNPCVPLPPYGYQAAMIGQNVISIILLFFIGLALRNYFKVK